MLGERRSVRGSGYYDKFPGGGAGVWVKAHAAGVYYTGMEG